MSERFIKYIPSEKSKWLRKHHTALYLLLSLAIEQARWSDDHNDGLMAGDSILGNFEDAGITRQQYRDALTKGESLGIWEVVYNRNCKKFLETQKRTIKRTIKCVVVNIKDSDVWDLNLNRDNQQKNQQGTNREPTENHKQEDLIRSKNEKIIDLIDGEENLADLIVARAKGNPSVVSIQKEYLQTLFLEEGYTLPEITSGIAKFKGTNPLLVNNSKQTFISYLRSILENQRKDSCKKKLPRKNLKISSKTNKETSLANATSEPILERLMRQNGLS